MYVVCACMHVCVKGTGEGKRGDWVLVGVGDDVYTCDAAIFRKTYARVPNGLPNQYRKVRVSDEVK